MAAKRYLYKVYNRGGAYAGLLQNVINEFGYSQDINSAGADLKVDLSLSLDNAGADTIEDIVQDEDSNDIVDQYGNPILASKEYTFTAVPINLNNRVIVYAFYEGAINGVVAFDGLITGVRANILRSTITLTVRSFGIQLDNYLVGIPPGTVVAEQLQVPNGYRMWFTNSQVIIGQSFTLASETSISGFNVYVAKGSTYSGPMPTATLKLRSGTPDAEGSILATASNSVTQPFFTNSPLTPLLFSDPISLPAGTYSFTVEFEADPAMANAYVGHVQSDQFAGGQLYYYISGGWATPGRDVTFQIITGGINVGRKFNSQDPSAILRSLLDDFQAFGGQASYDDTSIDNTNTAVSYEFKTDTVFDGIKTVLRLAPGNWYWFVDPATNLVHFHRVGASPDHVFTFGKHVENLDIEQTLDDMKNSVYFTGGDTGGDTNLVGDVKNSASITKYGQWLETMADNRVTDEDTASTLARGVLNANSAPTFRTELRIPSAVYDIETIHLGDMVAMRNTNGFIESLLLQVAGLSRTPHMAVLRLASNPPTVSHRIEDIKRNLDKLYTANNPS